MVDCSYTLTTFGCLVLASILSQQYVRAGILCYQCDLLPHQRDCDRIVECGSNEECYGSRLISDDGLTKFRSGCRDKSVCTVRAPIFGKRAELIPCSQCCNTSYCNLETCDNHITSNSKRCLSCKYALTPEDCNLSIQCNTDEVCYTQAIIHNQEKRYRLGCAHKNQCAARFDPVSGGVGRRAASDYCGQCCDGSNCNRELCTGKNIPHSKLTMPPPLSFCRDNSSSACAAHVNECSQDYYKYYQCPYTCKTCGAGPIITNAPVATMTTATTVGPSTPTIDPNLCIDFPGINCAPITCTVASIAKLCKKTCSLCSATTSPATTTIATTTLAATTPGKHCYGCTDQDPIPDCQCAYLDREANLCAESDSIEDLKRFCCYFCNKKKGIFTCPDVNCRRLEKPEQAEVDRMPKPIDCISN
ncbi:uncharacterized protein [Mytilus edulis]|uniref:uncharacterized protein isoform X4 n=1 Tax=Mytilus edulis TaxID=6550 RepID=UPI0039EF02F4